MAATGKVPMTAEMQQPAGERSQLRHRVRDRRLSPRPRPLVEGLRHQNVRRVLRRDEAGGHGVAPPREEPVRGARSAGNERRRGQAQGAGWGMGVERGRDVEAPLHAELQDTAQDHFNGRQYIKKMHGQGDDAIIMNIGKKGKLSTQSFRPHFEVGRGSDGRGRSKALIQNALIQNAVLGSGSESTIDVAPGVDCSTILAMVFGLGQVGAHFVKDMANNYIVDPIKDSLMDTAVETAGLEGAVDAYNDMSDQAIAESGKLRKFQKFFNETFK
ncbi:hypothetical protein THAOC_30646 [Thalassiosira oceanica]|uniref:Uncharacterized protein n=1 Tax=Thalassiosira oceanica TaxID=159749 RepID=K0RDP3_THAOC|nr:hypothetical protein THAOC_30646 [Thalassiosira oceanica]|eukprot:EJK50394.1 hypothetical protein THAOC_30646 [Thalassiosira oceanica]